MQTEVEMIRFIGNKSIRQKSKKGLFCSKDAIEIINNMRSKDGLKHVQLQNYFNSKNTKEFIEELKISKKLTDSQVVFVGKNKREGTWVHPYILIDISMWAYPKFKVIFYDWMFDGLIENRNLSGDSYKKMNIVLDKKFKIGARGWVYADVANHIAKEIGLEKIGNKWQVASEKQLKYRNDLQKLIIASAMNKHIISIDQCMKDATKVFNVIKEI